MEHVVQMYMDEALAKGTMTPQQVETMEKSRHAMRGAFLGQCKKGKTSIFKRKHFDCMMSASSIKDLQQCR